LRIDAAEKRELLEQEHHGLSTRKMVAVQNADQVSSEKSSIEIYILYNTETDSL
jgi:hypothetical protein